MEQKKVLRIIEGRFLECQEEQLYTGSGRPWHKENEAKVINLYPQCYGRPGFERGGKRKFL